MQLDEEKQKKSLTDLVIERSVELYGFTPDEKSDENMNWMRKNGFSFNQTTRYKRGTRGRRLKPDSL
jgi:hypothetical protein